MARVTSIEWCDATFNPWHGCEKVSPACAHCYAEPQAMRFAGGLQLWGAGHAFKFFGDKHWDEPLKWARTLPEKLGRRPRVFCASMADVFEERHELEEHRDRLFDLIVATPELDWLVLTKRPEAMQAYMVEALYGDDWRGGIIPNLWLGVSIENARFTWRADVLREIPAAVRFISAEPLLGSLFPVALTGEEDKEAPRLDGASAPVDSGRESGAARGSSSAANARRKAPLDLTGIDWLIIGGESGTKARPFDLEHARELVRAADAETRRRGLAKPVATFVKQLGARPLGRTVAFETIGDTGLLGRWTSAPMKLRDAKGGDWSEWPSDLRIREFPRVAAA